MKKIKMPKNGLNKPKNEKAYYCRDCSNYYDEQNKAPDGSNILCRCSYRGEGGKYLILLSSSACERFNPKK